ncbi:RICIN domain-containing protein [Streptomyces sp. SP18CS02]|uniref:RICIN domain-containing protein n=1 Tax=Streptomyces sp. SP18CS02 TaxID=3002531 RepID=UPI002E75DF27|nr:RICIN domain-containing protein [Streptomyces sp. SP18CS02]MEE1754487.1 RICIN domain-containing protein [Streptomyces sp. SP18CS02]
MRPRSGEAGQRRKATPLDDGEHTITSASSDLALTAASTADGAMVAQEADSGSALQRWTID